EGVRALFMWAAAEASRILIPGLAIMFVLACIAQVLQVGWKVTTQPIQPNFGRLNPVAGLRKLLNLRSLVRTTVNTVKLAVAGGIAYLVFMKHLPGVAALPGLGMAAALYKIALMALELTLWLLAIFLAVGIADYMYQRWQHRRDLRMTRQEVKDERRSVEGDPEVKAR